MIKLLRFLKSYRLLLVVVLVLAFAQAMALLYLPTLTADIVDNGIVKGDTGYIWRIGGIMTLVAIGGTICAVVGIFFSSQVATGLGKIVRFEIFTHVERFSLHEFDTVGTASLITRTTNDTTQVQQVLVMILNMMITAPMLAIGGVILALRQDAALAWILVTIMPVVAGTIFLIMSKAIPLFTVVQVKLDKLNLILNEGLAGVRVVRAFDRVKQEERRFDNANVDLTNVSIRVNRIVALMMPIMMLVLNVSSIAIIWFGSVRVSGLSIANGFTEVGSLFAFLQYAMQILYALLMVSMMFVMLPRAEASAKRINGVLEMKL